MKNAITEKRLSKKGSLLLCNPGLVIILNNPGLKSIAVKLRKYLINNQGVI
jgi:hypothetical protein